MSQGKKVSIARINITIFISIIGGYIKQPSLVISTLDNHLRFKDILMYALFEVLLAEDNHLGEKLSSGLNWVPFYFREQ